MTTENRFLYMKILRRYTLGEFAGQSAFGLAIFTFILLLDQIFQIVNMVVSKGVPLKSALFIFTLMLPNVLSLSIPVAVLFGAIIAYGRLSSDGEIAAVKTAGISHGTFMLPPVAAGFLMALILAYYNLEISPLTYAKFSQTYFNLAVKMPALRLEKKSITEIGSNKIYFENKKGNTLERVSIYKFDEATYEPAALIYASSASVSVIPDDNKILFRLYNGSLQRVNIKNFEETTALKFDNYNITIPFNISASYSRSMREYTAGELLREIKQLESSGLKANLFKTELNLRIAVGAAPFFFVFVGVPLGLLSRKGARAAGFAMTMAAIFIYYIFLAVGINLSDKGTIPSEIALQLPNLAALAAGIYLWRAEFKR